MTKFIMNIARVAACVFLWAYACGAAHAATLHFGPCEGHISEKGYGKTGNGTISAAVIIPKAKLARYAGARIKAVRVALITTDGLSELRGWIRTSLDSKNIDSTSVSLPHTGWNEIVLADGGVVSGDEDIVVGYSFRQELTVKCMSVAGPVDSNGYWIAKDGEWTDKSGDGKGSLGIELVIEGDNVPEKNIGVVSTSYDRITKFGDVYNASFSVQNTGNTEIAGYSYVCKINDTVVSSGKVEKTLEGFERDTVRLAITSDVVAKGIKIPVTIELSADGDGYAADNGATFYMTTYDEDNKQYYHNVLLEEFSTEMCGNCPRAINTIEQCMEQGYDKNVIQVTHHAGYHYDFLSTPDDKELEWFYGSEGCYAPAVMLDRLSDEQCKGILGGNEDSPVMPVGYADTFSPVLEYMTNRPAFVGVTPQVAYNPSTRCLDITVDIEKDPVFDAQCDNARLSVYIVQDSILHHHQAGYSSDTFRHRHVYRASVTPLYGEELAWNGNSVQKQYSYVLPEYIESELFKEEGYDSLITVVPRDIEVIAFVNSYNPNDRCDCTVFNAGRYLLKSDPAVASVVSLEDDGCKTPVLKEYYDMSGVRQSAVVNRGVYLQRIRYSDGTEKVVKVLK